MENKTKKFKFNLFDMNREGNVRIKASSPGIEISADAPVTISQLNVISRFASRYLRSRGRFYLDITDANGKYIASKRYDHRK